MTNDDSIETCWDGHTISLDSFKMYHDSMVPTLPEKMEIDVQLGLTPSQIWSPKSKYVVTHISAEDDLAQAIWKLLFIVYHILKSLF